MLWINFRSRSSFSMISFSRFLYLSFNMKFLLLRMNNSSVLLITVILFFFTKEQIPNDFIFINLFWLRLHSVLFLFKELRWSTLYSCKFSGCPLRWLCEDVIWRIGYQLLSFRTAPLLIKISLIIESLMYRNLDRIYSK